MYSIASSRGPPSFTRTHQIKKEYVAPDLDSQESETSNDIFLSSSSFTSSSSSTSNALLLDEDEGTACQASEVEEKSSDFVFRDKGVIEYNTAPANRCTHTTVRPSSMMALAMELQISNRGKASKMYRMGKLKAQDEDDDDVNEEEESRLAHLWVVPEADQLAHGHTTSTATHLQPSLVNADFVFQGSSTSDIKSTAWDTTSITPEMEEEDLALIANISVVDMVGKADCTAPSLVMENYRDSHILSDEKAANISSRTFENSDSCDNKLEVKFFEEQLNSHNNERPIQQETTKVIIEEADTLLSSCMKDLDSSANSIDETLFSNNFDSTANYTFQGSEMVKLKQDKTASDVSAIKLTSDEGNLTLNSDDTSDCKESKQQTLDAENDNSTLLTSCRKSQGQSDYSRKSIVCNFKEMLGKPVSHITDDVVLNDANKCASGNENILGEIDCGNQGAWKESCRLTDDNNNLIVAEISPLQKSELDENSTQEPGTVCKLNNSSPNRRLSPKKFAKKEPYTGNKDVVRRALPNSSCELTVSDPTLSSLSSSLFSVTSIESLSSTDSSQSVIMNASSCVSVTSRGTNFNIASQGTGASCKSNYLMQGSSNQIQTMMMRNSKEMIESRPSSINNVSAELKTLPSSGIAENENSNTQALSKRSADSSSVKDLDCGGRPRPWAGPLHTNSNYQNEPISPSCLTTKVAYEICKSEKVPLADLHPKPDSKTYELAYKNELNLAVVSPVSDPFQSEEICPDCENNMRFFCCGTTKKMQKNTGIEKRGSERFVQVGKDPIVERLRTTEKRKLTFGHYPNKNESAKIEYHQETEGIENGPNLNHNLADNQIEVVKDTNNQDSDTVRTTQQPQLQVTETSVQILSNNNELKENKVGPDFINRTKVTELYLEKEEIKTQSADTETKTVNKNQLVTVTNDSSGSKISLKKNKSSITSIDSKIRQPTSPIYTRESEPFVANEKEAQNDRKGVIINEAIITPSTAMQLQEETTADRSQLSKEKRMKTIKHSATVSFADMPTIINEKEQVHEPLEAKPAVSKVVRSNATSQVIDKEKNNDAETKAVTSVVDKKITSVEVIENPSDNCVVSASPQKPQVIVRTSSSESGNYGNAITVRRPVSERFAAAKAKYQNLIKTSSLQNISRMEVEPSTSKHGTASKSVFSSSVFVPIGARRRMFSEDEREATPCRTLDNSWRLKQKNPSSSVSNTNNKLTSNETRATSRPQRTMYRTWTNPKIMAPVEQRIRPRMQSQQESGRRDSPTPKEVELTAKPRITSSITNFRTSSTAVRPPRSSVQSRITTSGRFESGKSRQSSPGTRYRSRTRLSKKEMACVGNGSARDEDCGVVEGPSLTVKEIRARYKSRDYENFAVPKRRGSSTQSAGITVEDIAKKSTSSESYSSDVFHDEPSSNHQVAKQVMNLFKGALDFEKEMTVFENEAEKTYPNQTEQITPLKRNGHVVIRTSSSSSSDQQEQVKTSPNHVKHSPRKLKTSAWPPSQPASVEKVEKTDIKASVEQIKSETEAVSSFDESLDQFYNVLNDLTS